MDALTKLGIDWKLLIAQIINFLLVLFVLAKFLYKPILGMLDRRSKKIAQGLRDAEEGQAKLASAAKETEAQLANARKEAATIVVKAKAQGEAQASQLVEGAKREVETIVSQAHQDIASAKSKMMVEVKAETAALVVAAAKQVLGKTVGAAEDHRISEAAAEALRGELKGAEKQ